MHINSTKKANYTQKERTKLFVLVQIQKIMYTAETNHLDSLNKFSDGAYKTSDKSSYENGHQHHQVMCILLHRKKISQNFLDWTHLEKQHQNLFSFLPQTIQIINIVSCMIISFSNVFFQEYKKDFQPVIPNARRKKNNGVENKRSW